MRKNLGHKKNIRILTYRKYRRSMVFPFEMLIWKCKCHRIFPKQMTHGIHWIATPASIIPRINQSPSSIWVFFCFFRLPWLQTKGDSEGNEGLQNQTKCHHYHGTLRSFYSWPIQKPQKYIWINLHLLELVKGWWFQFLDEMTSLKRPNQPNSNKNDQHWKDPKAGLFVGETSW